MKIFSRKIVLAVITVLMLCMTSSAWAATTINFTVGNMAADSATLNLTLENDGTQDTVASGDVTLGVYASGDMTTAIDTQNVTFDAGSADVTFANLVNSTDYVVSVDAVGTLSSDQTGFVIDPIAVSPDMFTFVASADASADVVSFDVQNVVAGETSLDFRVVLTSADAPDANATGTFDYQLVAASNDTAVPGTTGTATVAGGSADISIDNLMASTDYKLEITTNSITDYTTVVGISSVVMSTLPSSTAPGTGSPDFTVTRNASTTTTTALGVNVAVRSGDGSPDMAAAGKITLQLRDSTNTNNVGASQDVTIASGAGTAVFSGLTANTAYYARVTSYDMGATSQDYSAMMNKDFGPFNTNSSGGGGGGGGTGSDDVTPPVVNPSDDIPMPTAPDNVATGSVSQNGSVYTFTIAPNNGSTIPNGTLFYLWFDPINLARGATDDVYGPAVSTASTVNGVTTLSFDANNLRKPSGERIYMPNGTFAVKFADAATRSQYVGSIPAVTVGNVSPIRNISVTATSPRNYEITATATVTFGDLQYGVPVTFTVIDANGNPVDRPNNSLYDTTGADGKATVTFTSIPSGTYRVVANADGYAAATSNEVVVRHHNSSSSGCDAGFGAFALLALAGGAVVLRKKD